MKQESVMMEGHAASVREIPERMRPREEMARVGVRNVGDDVLLSILLRSGVRGRSVVDLARHLLIRYGSLTALANASVEELAGIHGMGKVKAQVLSAALEMARRLNLDSAPKVQKIREPQDVASLLGETIRNLDREVFWVLPLDTKNHLKGSPVEVSAGLLDACLVHAREVFREAIRISSSSVLVAHNHPSGDTTPSAEDVRITRELVQAGTVLGIKLLDHIILGRRGNGDVNMLSIREQGLVQFG